MESTEQLSFINEEELKAKPKKFKPLLPPNERPTKVAMIKPPKETHIPMGYSWCPYCAKTVMLVKDKALGIHRCPLCGMGDKDYYMKLANK